MAGIVAAGSDGEPEWALLLTDPLDLEAARVHWSAIRDELQAGGRWSPVNEHAAGRLVMAYLLYDREARHVLEAGIVTLTAKTRVPQLNLHYVGMKSAAELALRLESELMLSPRKRGKAPMRLAKPSGGRIASL